MAKSNITIEAVRHVAKLAALALSPADEERMRAELNSILGYMEQLDELDVSTVEPSFHTLHAQAGLRPDHALPCLPRSELLAAAPEHDAGGFAVPKVLDTEG
jgi:aspartyl-tRNA(Asn)/glutamyl-tRNA(Gln) amidotransferase subunit C